eukprot:SAG22_NODE_2433_length_2578_cov_1.849133_2_plen_244_part_00
MPAAAQSSAGAATVLSLKAVITAFTSVPLPFLAVPLQMISGGGRFYDYNLDFGCCFGHVVPPPPVDPGPDTASSDEILLQLPGYRTLLVNGSTAGESSRGQASRQADRERMLSRIYTMLWAVAFPPARCDCEQQSCFGANCLTGVLACSLVRDNQSINRPAGLGFYPLNAEQDFGEAHTEVLHSANVTMFGEWPTTPCTAHEAGEVGLVLATTGRAPLVRALPIFVTRCGAMVVGKQTKRGQV